MFGLPDNIERSLQRSTSTSVIKQLRALSLLDAAAVKYDREKWRVQVIHCQNICVECYDEFFSLLISLDRYWIFGSS